MNELLPDLLALIGLAMLGVGVWLSLGVASALVVVGGLLLLLGVFTAKRAAHATE